MATHKTHWDFAFDYMRRLPKAETVGERSPEYWNVLGVNAPDVLKEARSIDFVEGQLRWLGVAGLRMLCLWFALDSFKARDALVTELAQYIVDHLDSPSCQLALFLIEFLSHRRTDAIESISKMLLSEDAFDSIHESGIDDKTKKFCYAALVFADDHRNLRLLMAFEDAERAGYERYALVPETEIGGKSVDDETALLVERKIGSGADFLELSHETVNSVLDKFEAKHGGHDSLCFDIFHDNDNSITLIFILRYIRDSLIREVDGVIFGEEAELIVLRAFDSGRTLEEHSTKGIGAEIGAAIVAHLLEEPNVKYVRDTKLTKRESFEELLDVLKSGHGDRIRLQEVYLDNAPLEESPTLILRCEKEQDLSAPLESAKERGLDLLVEPRDVRNIKITFIAELGAGDVKPYIFKVFCQMMQSGDYYLPYSAPNIPTRARKEFEEHLWESYDVRVIPGSR